MPAPISSISICSPPTPTMPNLLVAHGQNLVRLARFAEAFAAFDKATQIDPANGDAWSGLAFAASRTGRPDITLHALTMRSQNLPENPATLFLWARLTIRCIRSSRPSSTITVFLRPPPAKCPDQEWQARQRLQILGK